MDQPNPDKPEETNTLTSEEKSSMIVLLLNSTYQKKDSDKQFKTVQIITGYIQKLISDNNWAASGLEEKILDEKKSIYNTLVAVNDDEVRDKLA